MIKTGIMQPYLFPYLGYWQLIAAVDNYVIYDDVNFIKGGWINRNNILLNSKPHLFRFALNHASPMKKINEIELVDNPVNKRKFLTSIQNIYTSAPHFKNAFLLIEKILNYPDKNLANFAANQIKEICDYLDIKTKLILSSSLKKNCNLKGVDKVITICKELNSDIYINAIGGKELYDKNDFKKAQIELKFLQSQIVEYKQFKNQFVPWLSIIDLMMFNSKDQLKKMLNSYHLTT